MRYTRLAAGLLLAAYIPACTGYKLMADPLSELQASPMAVKEARVTLKTGERFQLASPRVDGDSLRGIPDEGPQVSVAMTDVAKVEVRKVSAGKTVALVVGIAAVAGVIGLAAAAASYGSSSTCSIDDIDYEGAW